ncbi:glycoside hydrolase domain-containing protein [Nocardioides sp.]|uniref:glycoside hydrolase domain-containing protein n=1 Tax=Nocardioides sp. TaxID=35761 RepID=UPI00260B76AF|nr:glycoside hydrolase domain-containing protein [Nocardioides sp.]
MFQVRPALLHPRTLLIAATVIALAVVFLVLPQVRNDTARTTAANPVTPRAFTGLGFDQCQAPKQSAMDAWRAKSPFKAVGIYVSGDSRACRSQTYLNSTWVSTQLAQGWHLLPIVLGPQASCQPRFPRYKDDFKISATATGTYAKASAQGTTEGTKSVADAKSLGIVPGSTLFYDLEGFTYTNTACRESALRFVSAWNARVKALGYRAGFYSSAGSGIKMIEAARVNRTAGITLPDVLWLARYDGKANTSATDYLSDAGWQGSRIKQFQGGHNETYGGVTINIDRNYLALAAPPATSTPKPATTAAAPTKAPSPATTAPTTAAAERHCGGVKVDLALYPLVRKPTATFTPRKDAVAALTCLLRERTIYRGPVTSTYTAETQAFVRLWRKNHGMAVNTLWTAKQWMWLLAKGSRPTLQATTTGSRVRDVQRALNAANKQLGLQITGSFNKTSLRALRAWRAKVGLPTGKPFGVTEWRALQAGRR